MTLGEYESNQKLELIESTFNKVKDVLKFNNFDLENENIKKGLQKLEEAKFWIEKGIKEKYE